MSPCWHLTYLKQYNIVFINQSHIYCSEQDQLPKELKLHSTTWESDINITTISPITPLALHTLNHTAPSPLFPQTGLGDTQAWSFSIQYSLSNHHKQDSHITRSKISHSFIESQPLVSKPAYSHEFQTLAFHPYSTFAAPLIGSAFKIQLEICGEVFLLKQSMCLGCWLWIQRSSVVDVWQLYLRFPPLDLH